MNEPDALERLINRYMDGHASADEVAQLNEALRADAQARQLFVEILNLDAALGTAAAGWVRAEATERVIAPVRWRWSWQTAAAAMAVLAFGLSFWLWNRDLPPAALAQLTDVSEPVWADRTAAPLVGATLDRQVLKLQSGAAQITFDSGVVLTLTGPAELALQNRRQVALHRGGVSLYVPAAGYGFTVVSPSGKFVDLGTEFSLDVDANGRSLVHVLDGAVRVEGRATTQLTAGYAARLAPRMQTLVTQIPLLVDRFDGPDGAALNANLARRQSEGQMRVEYRDLDSDAPARLSRGMLDLCIAAQKHRPQSVCRVMLDHDWRELVGQRYTIAFKAWLPQMGAMKADNWAAFVLWDKAAPATQPVFPLAYEGGSRIAVLLSSEWQVGLRSAGEHLPGVLSSTRVFARPQAAGPYQVMLAVDETGAVPLIDLTVNGVRVATRVPIGLGAHRYIGFHTWAAPDSGAAGYASIGDLRISVEPEGGGR